MCNALLLRSGLVLHSADEEEEVVWTKTRKRHKKLDFSGEGLAGLLLCLFCVQPVSLRSILVFSSNMHLPVGYFT